MKYRVDGWYNDDEWTEGVDEKITDLRWLAKDITEEFYQKDPCAPEDFKLTIQIIDNEGVLHIYEGEAELEVALRARKIYENN